MGLVVLEWVVMFLDVFGLLGWFGIDCGLNVWVLRFV